MRRLLERLGLRRVPVAGVPSRWYLRPAAAEEAAGAPGPALLCLHGRGEGAAAFAATSGIAAAAARHGLDCAVLQGQGTVPDWDLGRDLPVVRELVRQLCAGGRAVVLVGMSRGALLAHLAAATAGHGIGGLVSVAGVPPPPAPALPGDLPRLVVHGDLDAVVPPGAVGAVGPATTVVRLARHGHAWPGARIPPPSRLGPVSAWDATAAVVAFAARHGSSVLGLGAVPEGRPPGPRRHRDNG